MVNQSSKGVVLIADDSADALGMLNEALSKAGYTVLVAMDGQQVLSITRNIIPDIVLMDAIMPNMDGFDACRQLKQNSDGRDLPVIFMTGLSDSEHVVKGLEAGGVDYITKPVKLDELMARIRVHISNSRLTRSARSALDEIGQLAFACDIHGNIIWSTERARKLLSADDETGRPDSVISNQILNWLARKPDKDNYVALKGLSQPIQIRYVGQSSPGEYLMRLVEDDELSTRASLREKFSLTEREAEVLYWLSLGKTNRDIAQILSLSPRTVNKHLEQVYRKLGVENRTTAAAMVRT